jgi:hypothetical protein
VEALELRTVTSVRSPRKSSPLHRRSTMKAERFERNREARQALALSVAGVIAVMVVWNLMLFFH